MEEFYIHLSSQDSKSVPHNRPEDFRVQLPERVELQGTWVCALAEIEYTCPSPISMTPSLLVNTNVCDGSMVGNTKMPS